MRQLLAAQANLAAPDEPISISMSQGFHIDILDSGEPRPGEEGSARPWVGIRFDCCGTYSRVYRNPEGTAYEGRCPRCLRQICLRIGPDGTSARFFTAE